MKIDKKAEEYIEELEDKIVDLSLQLKAKKNELKTVQLENYERIRKFVHNLKNPVGAAYSFAEIISETDQNLPSKKLEKYIDVIKNSTKFSLETLDSLAGLNRLKTPNFKLNLKQTNYCELIETAINGLANKAEDKSIKIEKSFPKNDIYVLIDETEILQLITILVDNALRFSPENSTVSIEVSEDENTIETLITDEGIGMSESDLGTVFDEFSRVNTYSENGRKCVGLGLSIAKNIANFHHGDLTADSSLGKGSIFKIEIPKSYNYNS